MQEELTALMPALTKTVGEVEVMMKTIDKEKAEVVEPKKAIVQVEEEAAAGQAAAAKLIKDDCEAALAVAMPALQDALSALDTLKPADINYVKKLGNPPYIIKLVLEAVCVLLGEKPARVKDETGKMVEDYWKTSVLILANDKVFIDKLRSYDKDNIDPKIIKKIREKYLTDENFTPEKAGNASAAAMGLCKWVGAMDKYDTVAKVVAPKQAELAIAEAAYEEVMVGLRAKQGELKALLDKLAAMEEELRMSSKKKNNLETEVEGCSAKLERAEQLINGLGGEKV
jgi:dynein heavy chain